MQTNSKPTILAPKFKFSNRTFQLLQLSETSLYFDISLRSGFSRPRNNQVKGFYEIQYKKAKKKGRVLVPLWCAREPQKTRKKCTFFW